MSPKHAQWWKRTKARGLWHFVIVRGIVLWACGTFGTVALLMSFTDSWERFLTHNLSQPFTTLTALVLGGVIWGLAVWFWTDWIYRKYVAKNGVPPDAA